MAMDRLSSLPDALLHQILSFMPLQDAVKTTTFSKRWENLWISVPNLSCDNFSYPSIASYHDFVDFINRTLIFRGRNKIRSFRIVLFLDRGYRTDLDLWIRYALQNDVEELFLDLRGDQSFYLLPQFLYSSSVKVMRLKMCSMALDRQITWTSLKSLTLCFVKLRREVIQKVLLGCPNLESLEVSNCWGFDGLTINSTCLKNLIVTLDLEYDIEPAWDLEHDIEPALRISAPNVTFLHLSGFLYRKCLLVDMFSLVHATLDFKAKLYDVEGFDYHQDMLLEVLQSLDHVENLTLGTWCIKVLSMKEKKGLPSPPSRRKCFSYTNQARGPPRYITPAKMFTQSREISTRHGRHSITRLSV